jgi:hypothetical protein
MIGNLHYVKELGARSRDALEARRSWSFGISDVEREKPVKKKRRLSSRA